MKKSNKKEGEQSELRCSFCNLGTSEVYRLITGPGVNICDECVMLCYSILTGENPEK